MSLESMRTGGKILADLAQNTNSDVKPRDIVAKHLSESVGKVLSGRGRKRKRNTATTREPVEKRRRRSRRRRKPNR